MKHGAMPTWLLWAVSFSNEAVALTQNEKRTYHGHHVRRHGSTFCRHIVIKPRSIAQHELLMPPTREKKDDKEELEKQSQFHVGVDILSVVSAASVLLWSATNTMIFPMEIALAATQQNCPIVGTVSAHLTTASKQLTKMTNSPTDFIAVMLSSF